MPRPPWNSEPIGPSARRPYVERSIKHGPYSSCDLPVSEDTINDLVADYLRGEFAVDITTQPTGQIPAGRRKPDFELHWDGKTYLGEGEWL